MQIHCWKFIWILFINSFSCIVGFELITGALVGLTSVFVDYTFCKFKECCTSKEIPADFDRLERDLNEKVYGQHLALQVTVNALKAHWNKYKSPSKALTLSFHGWPGGGKNYIASFIKTSLYKEGAKSHHVHHFIGRTHFPRADKVEEYKTQLYSWIKGNVTRCDKQLFIFDEVNKMPPGVLNAIKPMIDYHENIEELDYRQSIFIFLSNTGESLITDKAVELWKSGVARDDIKLKDFENIITMGAFNEEGGFYHSDTIKSNLIDHYIPFLPMEQKHVRLCILDQFRLREVTNPSEDYIREVMDFVEWGPEPHNLFSKTGCKRLSQKVGITIENYNLRNTYL